ncbi:F-box protein [Aspergillus lucknowensis]|uniref:F-box domain-containing protein n=1 Tax=Aspergillus lucknowensis TaxID=176173 RepID=A0ABR4LVX9_9EURO
MPAPNDSTPKHQLCNPTTTDGIRSLPPEIVLQILSYLSFGDLLAFGATCSSNHGYHIASVKGLRLGVFEKRVHSIISLLQAGWASPDQLAVWGNNGQDFSYMISVVLPQNKLAKRDSYRVQSCHSTSTRRRSQGYDRPRSQEHMIRVQNQIVTRVLGRYGAALRSLEFMAYDLDMEGATALGTRCQHTLRHLALRFEHPHIRDGLMRPSTWLQPAPGNEAWNSLIGVGGNCKGDGLQYLDTLILERAGITSWQLMMLVKRNPNLKTLKLRTCRGARSDFLYWLGGIKDEFEESETQMGEPAPGAKLEVLWLEHCHRILPHPVEENKDFPDEMCDSGFEWVRGLNGLRSLSFSESTNIPSELVDRANKTIWKVPEVILPYSLYGSSAIAVDPRWK